MRIRMMVAAGLGAAVLCASALSMAPAARADVGDVDISFLNSSGVVIGTDQDVFNNLLHDQCDNNQPPSGTASVSVTNLSDETVDVGQSCGSWQASIPALGTFSEPWGNTGFKVYAPAGA